MVFGSGKVLDNIHIFTYNKEIETVDTFKYLGVFFIKNEKFYQPRKFVLAQGSQESKVRFSILSKASKLYLPIDILLDLFDHMVTPVLIWK